MLQALNSRIKLSEHGRFVTVDAVVGDHVPKVSVQFNHSSKFGIVVQQVLKAVRIVSLDILEWLWVNSICF